MNKRLAAGIAAAALVIAGCFAWFESTYVHFQGERYAKKSEYLDLRDKSLTLDDFDTLQAMLPECKIAWQVPVGGEKVDSDSASVTVQDAAGETLRALERLPNLASIDATALTEMQDVAALQARFPDAQITYCVTIDGTAWPRDSREITLSHLTDEEAALLEWLPELERIETQGCTDYPQLLKCWKERPSLEIDCSIPLMDQSYPWDTEHVELANADCGELAQMLQFLPKISSVTLEEPEGDANAFREMLERYPDIQFSWGKTVLGQYHTGTETEIDFSGIPLTTPQVEEAMAWFPAAEKVILSNCGMDSPTLGEFREKMRSQYKVVWTVRITGIYVRTDETVFHSSAHHMSLEDGLSSDLYYCEDMIVVDVGHGRLRDISWVEGMPNLKYLIVADNWLTDITPVSTCKNLIYLELLKNSNLVDISPVIGCTALQDVSVSNCFVVDTTPFAQMPWLKNLWANNCNVSDEQLAFLQENLPDTHIQVDSGYYSGGGWRELQNYADMRDIMGMPRNTW